MYIQLYNYKINFYNCRIIKSIVKLLNQIFNYTSIKDIILLHIFYLLISHDANVHFEKNTLLYDYTIVCNFDFKIVKLIKKLPVCLG